MRPKVQVDKMLWLYAVQQYEYLDLQKMVTDTTSALLKLRLEKAVLEKSNQSVLLDEEKYILDSRKEMAERKETILSGILNGKPHSLDNQ